MLLGTEAARRSADISQRYAPKFAARLRRLAAQPPPTLP
jgi:hypothetical protein